MTVTSKTLTFTSLLAALLVAGCGDPSSGRSPSKVIVTGIQTMQGGAGSSQKSSGPLNSDVLTKGSVFDDLAEVAMQLTLKDQGVPGTPAKPSDLNAVTFSRYHVEYRRADGRNIQGVDVPYAFDGAVTTTVVAGDGAAPVIELVRHVAKVEAPLGALVGTGASNIITTIATVTFYGKDQAGNNVKVSADIQVNFGDFADPTS